MLLLKILVVLIGHFGPMVFQGRVQAQEPRDRYLEMIRENGEVIGCSTQESFQKLLEGTELALIAEFCRPHELTGDPVFLGWWFFDGPEYDLITPDDQFVVARKYVMEAPEGTIRFAWPYPLDPSEYAMFEGPYTDEPTAEELAEYAGNEDAAEVPLHGDVPQRRNPHAIYL